jgi:hypothetical protein
LDVVFLPIRYFEKVKNATSGKATKNGHWANI